MRERLQPAGGTVAGVEQMLKFADAAHVCARARVTLALDQIAMGL